MKRYVHSREDITKSSFSIDKIDLIVIANDARLMNLRSLPISAAKNNYSKDFDQFSKEELIELDDRELRSIESPYALDLVCEAINEGNLAYKLTKRQKQILNKFYLDRSNSSSKLTQENFEKLKKEILECKTVTGPDFRPGQPEKNFETVHGVEMSKSDYLAIIKNLEYSDLVGSIKSAELDRIGILLYEFICDPKGYKLKFGNVVLTNDIRIYIKIIPHYQVKYNIAIISFHDAEAENLSELENK